MNSVRSTILYVLACVGLCALVVACVPQRSAATEKLDALVVAAAEDGALSLQEVQAIVAAMKEAKNESGGVNWLTLGLGLLGGAARTFLLPNSLVIGAAEAAAVNRSAGLA